MRGAPAAVVAFLLLVSSIRPQISTSAANTATTLTTEGINGCKTKRRCDPFDCHFPNKDLKNSSSLLEDDKRVVPTGPNPLHNL
ncbi:hypothetical protein KFK09_013071 [Dendrobium nobile]|uniref:Uncharacterized protein n=1 Tax=Dendrobium nobile TaxID=94219 RepID=A0A8T3BH84_DENNO|nr:hypothetical protein KFK09_013071 [Dendrobium nobile]